MRKRTKFPKGWNEKRVQEVLTHYEAQTEEEAIAEYEAMYEEVTETVMEIPTELVPAVRTLLANYWGGKKVPA
ncbi:MAG: hypothetical protein AAF614_20900 [Chloroflexota bacterium]